MNYSVEYLISQLRLLQNTNGSFSSINTTTHETMDSVYFTSLILISLRNLIGYTNQNLELIVNSALAFLSANESVAGSWNYYPRALTSPYPDDIDDTILALNAIEIWKPELVTPDKLAQVTHLLIRCEDAPGGPYKTWITPENSQEPWNDIDTVVNYSIQSWLASHNIHLEPLDTFLNHSAVADTYHSLYYNDPPVITYLTGNRLLPTESHLSPINSCHPLRAIFELLQKPYHRHLRDVDTNEYITDVIYTSLPYNFFIEKITDEVTEYAGCKAMELSLCIELLSTHKKDSPLAENALTPNDCSVEALKPDTLIGIDEYIALMRETIISRFSEVVTIRDFFVKHFDQLSAQPSIQILLPYYYVAGLAPIYRDRITTEQLVLIGSAHSIGLISFTGQDALCDRQVPQETIPYISSGIIGMNNLFHDVLYGESTLEEITSILHTMNQSLVRETTKTNSSTPIREELYLKSFGLICGIVSIVIIVAGRHTFTETENLKLFFKNYLNARQLLDDLHDWYDDLQSDIRTPVTALTVHYFLEQRPNTSIDYTNDKLLLHKIFWNYSFAELTHSAEQSITTAKASIADLVITKLSDLFTTLLKPLENALSRARTESSHQQAFISAYEKATLASGS